MADLPVIVLAFANEYGEEQYLARLAQEQKQLWGILKGAQTLCEPELVINAAFDVEPLARHFIEFLQAPDALPPWEAKRYPHDILNWLNNGMFVLNYNNNYWLDASGVVHSS